MTGHKSKMESLIKNHHDNDILGTDASTKFLGPGTVRIDSWGTESMKFQCSNSHTQLSWRQVAYIREFEAIQSCTFWFDEEVVGRSQKNDLIWFIQLSIIFSVLMIDDYSLWMLFRSAFDPHKLLMTWCIYDWWWCLIFLTDICNDQIWSWTCGIGSGGEYSMLLILHYWYYV